ncbi:MAG: hypothetical protein ABI702_09065 [Burkholderiales bacterium]
MTTSPLLMILKLALVAASILGASLLARRYGHAVSGALAGLPVIVGPIIAILLIDLPAERVRGIALATLVCQPAMLAHIVVFARAARRFAWPVCLALAMGAYGVAALGLSSVDWPPLVVIAVVLVALTAATRALPVDAAPAAPVAVPASELWWRLAAALAIAATVMWGADHLPAAIAGALLALPITGSVLPCFTLPRHGPRATARLLGGFVRGQSGFVAFFIALVLLLPVWPKAAAFIASVACAVGVPWGQRAARPRGTTDAA